MLAGCASATAFRVDRSDVIGPCQTAVPDRDVLFGVALSGGGSRAALFGEAGLEALARLRTADGASVIDKISHLSSVSGGSIAAAYYALKKPGRELTISASGARPAAPAFSSPPRETCFASRCSAVLSIHQMDTEAWGGPPRAPT